MSSLPSRVSRPLKWRVYFGGAPPIFAAQSHGNCVIVEALQNEGVPLGAAGERRSERVLMDVPVVIRGQSREHRSFQEETFTVTVSAHGALLMLATKVARGEELVLTNPANSDERQVRVAYIGGDHAGLSQVAVEFYRPSPEFWPVSSPPPNWKTS